MWWWQWLKKLLLFFLGCLFHFFHFKSISFLLFLGFSWLSSRRWRGSGCVGRSYRLIVFKSIAIGCCSCGGCCCCCCLCVCRRLLGNGIIVVRNHQMSIRRLSNRHQIFLNILVGTPATLFLDPFLDSSHGSRHFAALAIILALRTTTRRITRIGETFWVTMTMIVRGVCEIG